MQQVQVDYAVPCPEDLRRAVQTQVVPESQDLSCCVQICIQYIYIANVSQIAHCKGEEEVYSTIKCGVL